MAGVPQTVMTLAEQTFARCVHGIVAKSTESDADPRFAEEKSSGVLYFDGSEWTVTTTLTWRPAPPYRKDLT